MKKKIYFVFSCILACLFLFGGCFLEGVHTHKNEYYTVVEPTCVKEGTIEITCTACGYKEYDKVLALGHNYVNGACTRCNEVEEGYEGETHQHEMGYSILTEATCTEKGVMQGACRACDYRETVEVQALGHNYVNGVCTRCGKDFLIVDASKRFDFITFQEIYELLNGLNLCSKEENFYKGLQESKFSNLSIDSAGFLKVNQSFYGSSFSFAVPITKQAIKGEFSDASNAVSQINITNGIISVLYGDGVVKYPGSIDTSIKEYVEGFAFNESNYVFLLFNTDKALCIGKLLDRAVTLDNSALIYCEIDGGYEVIGGVEKDSEKITVYSSHLGKKVVSIGQEAFSANVNLRSVILMEGIEEIKNKAFSASLQDIVIPASVTMIERNAFADSMQPLTVYYGGTQSNWEQFASLDCLLEATVYYYSETQPLENEGNYWRYVEGVPTVWGV